MLGCADERAGWVEKRTRARLLEREPAAAVDIPLRLAVIAAGSGAEIVLRDMRSLLSGELADTFTALLRGLAAAARDRVA